MGDKYPNNSMKKQVIPQQSSKLSDDLVFEEILTRLPLKSVLRFKSVSKQWYSTLSSSDFAKAHFIKSALSNPCAPVNTLFIKSENSYYIFSYDDDQISGNFEDNLFKLDVDFEDKLDVKLGVGNDCLALGGSCNGLVCLTPTDSDKYFIIWNPVTGKLHKYTSDGYLREPSYRISEACYVRTVDGFGYASSVDDYKYVRILALYFGNETCNIFLIFCLKENNWRKLEFVHDVIQPFGRAVLVNEKLYWPAHNDRTDVVIVSFDLGVEKFDVIKVDLDETDILGFMGGCLSKYNHHTFIGDKLLHILEPPAVVKSIGLPEGLRLGVGAEMIGFTRTGKFFVTGTCNEEPWDDVWRRTLRVVDTRTTPVQYTTLLRFDNFFRIARYFPSLVSPFAIGEPSEA